MNMKNIGLVDKVLRIIVGLALIAWALSGGPIWAWIGVIPLVTALMGWCPAYSLIGVSTAGAQGEQAENVDVDKTE